MKGKRNLDRRGLHHGRLQQELRAFTHPAQSYPHGRYAYTEGVRYLAERIDAYWLIDAILSLQLEPRVAKHAAQNWMLRSSGGDDCWSLHAATIDDRYCVYAESIEWKCFPMPDTLLCFADCTLMLASEYKGPRS